MFDLPYRLSKNDTSAPPYVNEQIILTLSTLLTHTQDKRFVCSQCGKSFVRSHRDTLHRHQITHRTNSIGTRSGSADALSSRACRTCANARVRCTRQIPCERCHLRRIQCVYEESDQRPELAPERPTSMASVTTIEDAPGGHQDVTTMDHGTVNSNPQASAPAAGTTDPSFLLPQHSQAVGEQTSSLLGPGWAPQNQTPNPAYNFQDQGMGAPFTERDTVTVPATNWLPYTNSMDWDFDFYMTQALNNFSPAVGMDQSSIWSPSAGPLERITTNLGTSPGNISKSSMTGESPASMSVTASVAHGTFYADGEVSRLSRRRNIAESLSNQEHVGSVGSGYDYDTTEAAVTSRDAHSSFLIPTHTYGRMVEKFGELCVAENPLFPFERLQSDRLPSHQAMEMCINSYFENSSSSFPVVHKSTTKLEGDNDWILCLAMAAMGAVASSSTSLISNAEALRTFLQRTITMQTVFSRRGKNSPELSLMQACIIYDILELHLQDNDNNEEALAGTESFSNICADIKRHRWLSIDEPNWDGTWTEDSWRAWIHRESQRRVAYCAWLLDTWNLLTSGKILSANFSLADVQTNLPVHEALWAAGSLGAWLNLKAVHKEPAGLIPLLRTLYQQQPLNHDLGEFSQTIAVHAVCRRTREVGLRILDPLRGIDAGQHPSGESVRDIYWLPSDPEYQKWRNKTLDCLDSLHWATHAVIARLQGLEPPVVLHLHISRLVLLVPYQDIYDLICEVVSSHGNDPSFAHVGSSRIRREDLVAKIWLWISKDHYKSRLAIVHAGAMFWFIRHHGTGNIYEPRSLFMSSIILWAYGSFVPLLQATNDEDHPVVPRTEADEEYDPTMIQIDRPCDDELIQIFIRRGNAMQPHMLGVGNICQPGGALGVLKIGAKLIKNRCSAWPISKTYENLLLHCAQVSARGS
ncbi:hypothetical protein D6D03_03078 [Aureobasidium pullulans]|nr:hypothetical protein D6D03_03078 [Aureobasidium pullulans]